MIGPSSPKGSLLDQHRVFASDDLDAARDFVGTRFCDHRLEIVTQAHRFRARHHRAEGRQASLNLITYGADVEIEPGELDSFYLVQLPLSGRAEIDNGAGQVGSGPGLGSVLNPHRHTRMRWLDGCSQLLLQIDAKALHGVAERLVGRALPGPVTFETEVNDARPGVAAWTARLRTCAALADQGTAFAKGRALTQHLVEEQLIESFLLSQPSDISDLMDRPVLAPGRPHVRRAMAYIHAHLDTPLTIGAVADAVGLTPRSLQSGFRSALGLTPMQYLRQERLRYARYLLRTAGPDTQIGEICDRAGFSHFGRFSALYRDQFGENPRDTRRKA